MKIYTKTDTNPFFFSSLQNNQQNRVNQSIRNPNEIHQVRTGYYCDDSVVANLLKYSENSEEIAQVSGQGLVTISPLNDKFKGQIATSSDSTHTKSYDEILPKP